MAAGSPIFHCGHEVSTVTTDHKAPSLSSVGEGRSPPLRPDVIGSSGSLGVRGLQCRESPTGWHWPAQVPALACRAMIGG